jgi:hypothetical protein
MFKIINPSCSKVTPRTGAESMMHEISVSLPNQKIRQKVKSENFSLYLLAVSHRTDLLKNFNSVRQCIAIAEFNRLVSLFAILLVQARAFS